MLSEPIPDPDPNVGVCSIWPRRGCLFVWPFNPIGHNEDVVSAGGGGGGGLLSRPTLDRGETSWHYKSMGSSQPSRLVLKL